MSPKPHPTWIFVGLLVLAVVGIAISWWSSGPDAFGLQSGTVEAGKTKPVPENSTPTPASAASTTQEDARIAAAPQPSQGSPPGLEEWMQRYSQAADDAKREEVLSEAAASEDMPLRAALVMHALKTGSSELRINALQTFVGSSGMEQVPPFKAGIDDPDLAVRDAALQFARDQELPVRMAVFEHAITSANEDMRRASLLELSRETEKAAMPALLRGLGDQDAGFRNEVWNELAPRIQRLRTEPFGSRGEAEAWWAGNAQKFDDQMNLID